MRRGAEPLVVGLITTFESPVISLGDQATALEASAEAFNERGGANGSCIEVDNCDDGGQPRPGGRLRRPAGRRRGRGHDQRPGHGRPGGDLGRRSRPPASPASPGNVTNNDWADQNAYPLDASGTGTTFLMPQALIDVGGSPRSGSSGSTAPAPARSGPARGHLRGRRRDLPVRRRRCRPARPTSRSSSRAPRTAGAGGVMLALGEQEAVQVVRAGQQLGTDLAIGG